MKRIARLCAFLNDSLGYFALKLEGIDRDRYFADRDVRSILDKTINDIILCTVDICEQVLRTRGRAVPDTYRDTILACHDSLGDIVLELAPLTKRRNELVHQYLKINWNNIQAVRERIPALHLFISAVRSLL